MVTIEIIIEGGLLPNVKLINTGDESIKNRREEHLKALSDTLRLRQSFNKLFQSSSSNQRLKINCIAGGPDKQAAKSFRDSDSSFLLIDMEGREAFRKKRLENIGLSEHPNQERIFFMIQKMEAWILSQPDKIESCFNAYRKTNEPLPIGEDETLKNIDPESISNPDRVLQTILKRYFEIRKRDRVRNFEYGK